MNKPSCTTKFALLIGTAGLLFGTVAGQAGDPAAGGLYLNTDAGLNLAGNLSAYGLSISTDPGVRWDLSLGYAFKVSDAFTVATELETGIIYNSLDQWKYAGDSGSINGSYTQVPIMANVIVDWHIDSDWTTYAGAGAGYDYNSLDVSNLVGNDLGSSSESDFAWQLKAGIKYKLGDSSELGLGYEYLAVKPSGLGTIGNNAIFASYTFHF